MLYIKDTIKNIKAAKEAHSKAIKCRVFKKVTGDNCGDSSCNICKSTNFNSSSPKELINLVKSPKEFNTLITGKPKEIFDLNEKLWKAILSNRYKFSDFLIYLSIKSTKDLKTLSPPHLLIYNEYNTPYKSICSIFDYYAWFQNNERKKRYDIYELAQNLDRNTCTYCNRIYTSTMLDKNNKKVMRPQFDHWFPQTKYPLLALSFYNLIPSCSTCNSSIKNDASFHPDTHLHPYIDIDSLDRITFSYDHSKALGKYDIKIKFSPDDKIAFRTIKELRTKEMYSTHISELKDLIKIKESYSESYINFLITNFPKAKLSSKEVYKLAFGAELENDDFHKKPLSKFKKDILAELGIKF